MHTCTHALDITDSATTLLQNEWAPLHYACHELSAPLASIRPLLAKGALVDAKNEVRASCHVMVPRPAVDLSADANVMDAITGIST